MDLPTAAVLTLTLVSICTAHVINIPVAQANRPIWRASNVPRQLPPLKQAMKPLHQLSKQPILPIRKTDEEPKTGPQRFQDRPMEPLHQFYPWPPQYLENDIEQRARSNRVTSKPRDIKLTNLNDVLFYGSIGIGTPEQRFNVTFSTASPTTWVPSIHSKPTDSELTTYNNQTSSTYIPNGVGFQASYGEGEVAGYRSQDNLNIAGLTARNQIFGEAIVASDFFRGTPNQGVLGLGFSDAEPTVFDNLADQGLLPAAVFSFYLSKHNSGDPDPVLTLGGTNPAYYVGDFTFADLTVPDSWQFKMDRVQLSSGTGIFNGWGCQAVVDSSTPLIIGPKEEVDVLNRKLGGTPFPGDPTMYELDCSEVDNLPDVEFIVNGKKLSLTNKDYVVTASESGRTVCYSGIMGSSWKQNESPVWILGLSFMKVYYTQFDKENYRIGFAKALTHRYALLNK